MSFVAHFSLCGKFSSLGKKKIEFIMYIMELPAALLKPSLKNKKKSFPKKILIFSQKKGFLKLWGNGTLIF